MKMQIQKQELYEVEVSRARYTCLHCEPAVIDNLMIKKHTLLIFVYIWDMVVFVCFK